MSSDHRHRTAPDHSNALPSRPGVYRFRDQRGRTLYVGRAADLRSRVRSYWGALPDRRHLRRMVAQVDRIEAVVCGTRHEAAWLERCMLEHRMPRWNRTPGGQELPVWLLVTDQGVELEHRSVPTGERFGPYLGAVQARGAADALDRIYHSGTRRLARAPSGRWHASGAWHRPMAPGCGRRSWRSCPAKPAPAAPRWTRSSPAGRQRWTSWTSSVRRRSSGSWTASRGSSSRHAWS